MAEAGKKCSRCLKLKALEDFHRDSNQPSGRRPDCRLCRLKREKELYHKYPNRKMTNKNSQLKKVFGISINKYFEMQNKQENKCAICLKESGEIDKKYGKIRDLVVDHNHKTGKIRELLCGPCNRALGGFKENVETLKNAIKYIKKHGAL